MFKLLDLIATHRRKTDLEDLERLLKRLHGCTLSHFTHEERLMRVSGFPGFLDHHLQHQSIANTIREALGQVSRGLMISPVAIARMKEAYTFHFKRDDMPFMNALHPDSGMEVGPGPMMTVACTEQDAPSPHHHEQWGLAVP